MMKRKKVGATTLPPNDADSGTTTTDKQHKGSDFIQKRKHLDFSIIGKPISGLIRKPRYLVDLSDGEGDHVDFLLSYKGIGILPRGDIHAITGAKKSGKTTFSLLLIVAMLMGEYKGFKTNSKKPLRILIVDTEQNLANVKTNARRIHRAAGLNEKQSHERLRILALRRYNWKERINIIYEEIKAYRPDYVLIDGISDLTKTANDEESSVQAIQMIMTLSADFNCGISAVLHLNKSDKKFGIESMRGHEGTELGNKATETYIIRRNANGITEVEQADCRNDRIQRISFTVEGVGEEKEVRILNEEDAQEREFSELYSFFEQIFKDESSIPAGDLYKRMECSENTAREKCSLAKNIGILEQIKKGKSRLYTIKGKPIRRPIEYPQP